MTKWIVVKEILQAKKQRHIYSELYFYITKTNKMGFKRGDIVIAKINKDPSIEAVVDFEANDGKVYISEWGRPLTYPTRLIVDKSKLFLKEKQIKIPRQQMQELIWEFFGEELDYLNLKGYDDLVRGDKIKMNNRLYEVVQDYHEFKILGRLDEDYAHGGKFIAQFYGYSRGEIEEKLKTKDIIIKKIFGTSVKEKDIVIVDDETREPL